MSVRTEGAPSLFQLLIPKNENYGHVTLATTFFISGYASECMYLKSYKIILHSMQKYCNLHRSTKMTIKLQCDLKKNKLQNRYFF